MDSRSIESSPIIRRPYEDETETASSFNGDSVASVAHGYVANSVVGAESSRRSGASKPSGPSSSTCACDSVVWSVFLFMMLVCYFLQWMSSKGNGCVRRGEYFIILFVFDFAPVENPPLSRRPYSKTERRALQLYIQLAPTQLRSLSASRIPFFISFELCRAF